MVSLFCKLLVALLAVPLVSSTPVYGEAKQPKCRKTKVAVLGAGVAGITAGYTLTQNKIKDFLILEYNDRIGGRLQHTEFGKDAYGKPYVVETGANWIQGTRNEEKNIENPVWTYCKKYGVKSVATNYEDLETFTEKGPVDYLDVYNECFAAYEKAQAEAGRLMLESLPDRTLAAGMELAGWKRDDPIKDAIDWFWVDFERGARPEYISQLFSLANYNATYLGISEDTNLAVDQRGFNFWLRGLASEYLASKNFVPNDPRLLFNTIVEEISWSDRGVTIRNRDGSCVEADYAISTFSLGVLKNGDIKYVPELPKWKRDAINSFDMSIFTKVFMQFPKDKVFWNQSMQYFLYASPTERGLFPTFRGLDSPDQIPGSGIIFAVVTSEVSRKFEAQDDATTKEQMLEVLRQMFGAENVPEPTAFFYPRWGQTPWALGSYVYWPAGVTIYALQNLRANVGRLWFAGADTSAEYSGSQQGAFFTGAQAAQAVADCLKGKCVNWKRYEGTLPKVSRYEDFSPENGWNRFAYDIEENS